MRTPQQILDNAREEARAIAIVQLRETFRRWQHCAARVSFEDAKDPGNKGLESLYVMGQRLQQAHDRLSVMAVENLCSLLKDAELSLAGWEKIAGSSPASDPQLAPPPSSSERYAAFIKAAVDAALAKSGNLMALENALNTRAFEEVANSPNPLELLSCVPAGLYPFYDDAHLRDKLFVAQATSGHVATVARILAYYGLRRDLYVEATHRQTLIWRRPEPIGKWYEATTACPFSQEGSMDPIANLKEQRELAQEILDIQDDPSPLGGDSNHYYLLDKAARLAELVQALDEWRLGGGFDPYLTKTAYAKED